MLPPPPHLQARGTERNRQVQRQVMERSVVVFSLAGESYGLAVERVREIAPMKTITETEFAVDGLISLHGKSVPVVDLRRQLGIPSQDESEGRRMLVADVDGRAVGLIVDAVTGVLPIRAEAVGPASEATSPVNPGCLEGVARVEADKLWLLDLDHVFPRCERAALFSVPSGSD